MGRFLNEDEPIFVGASGTLLSNNLYSYCENNPVVYFDPTGHNKTYVFYYNYPGSDFYVQAYNSPYYNINSSEVILKPVIYSKDFISAWNSMSGTIDYIYLYLHGGAGLLYFRGEEMSFNGSIKFSSLSYKKVQKCVYLFSCYGGSAKAGGVVAYAFANATSCKVQACTGSVSYLKIGGKYYARKAFDFGVFKYFYPTGGGGGSW